MSIKMERVGKQFGHYRLLRLLGRGGFASVYLGEHIHLKSLAAIKVLSTRLTEDLQQNFRNEARILARLSHSGIIRLLDFGIDEGVPFLVMEYAPHGTLRQLHPHSVKLPLVMVVNYVNQIADGLQYAHDQNLIHRDLKPDNVLIGQRGNLHLSDFGLALIAQTTGTRNPKAGLAGTAAYMAPEQLRGMPQLASDQYALGIMVYEWLCGRRPFHGTLSELYSQHASVLPQPLREHVPDLSREVEQVVLRALSKVSDERFLHVKAFAAALEWACQVDNFTPPALLREHVSSNLHTSHQPDLPAPQTPLLQPEPSTSPPAHLPPSHTEASTSSQIFLAVSQTPVLQPEQAALCQVHLPVSQFVQLQKSSDLSPLGRQPSFKIVGKHPLRKKLSRRAILLLVALVLLIIVIVISSPSLSIFSQRKQRSTGDAIPTQIATLRLGGSAAPEGVAPSGGTPSSNTLPLSQSKPSPDNVSSSKGTVSARGTSLSTVVITPTAQPVPTTSPTFIPTPTSKAATPAAMPTPTPAAMPTPTPAAMPTPTPAAQGCTTYNWTLTSSQTGFFTTSVNCNTINVTLGSGLLTQITMQACTVSGCGPSQLVLPGNTATLLSNVSSGTSFYLKTTLALPLHTTLSGVVSC